MLVSVVLIAACEGIGTEGQEQGQNQGSGKTNKDKTEIHMIDGLSQYEVASDKDTVFIRFVVSKEDNDADWEITTSAPWCTASPSKGKGLGEVSICCADNETASVRGADVVIKSGSVTSSFKVSQSLFGGAKPAESWFSKSLWDRTDRERAGLRGPVKSWYLDAYTTYRKYYYDEAGHLLKEEWHDLDKNLSYTEWDHVYDAAGHRIKSSYNFDEGDGTRCFSYEYNNTGKLVASNAYNWIDFEEGYISGKEFPMSIIKDLSAIHYLDSSIVYYERTDMTFTFGSDGNLTIDEKYYRDHSGDPQEHSVYHIIYENGYPVSCPESEVAVTFDANGRPLTLSESDGEKTFTFTNFDRILNASSIKEPNARGMLAMFWADYSYNANGDQILFKRAYFDPETVYTDTFNKYFYDSYGNWIQRDETTEPAFQHGQFFTDTIKRAIEYY